MATNPFEPPKEVGAVRPQRTVWLRIAFILGALLLVGWVLSLIVAFIVVDLHYRTLPPQPPQAYQLVRWND
jgi:hypothetical protein